MAFHANYMKFQALVSWLKKKKKITSLSSADFAKEVLKPQRKVFHLLLRLTSLLKVAIVHKFILSFDQLTADDIIVFIVQEIKVDVN